MSTPLAIELVATAIVIAFLGAVWARLGAKPWKLGPRALVAILLILGSVTAIGGLAGWLLGGFIHAPTQRASVVGALAAGSLVATLLFRRVSSTQRLRSEVRRLADPATRVGAASRIRALLAEQRPAEGDPVGDYAALVLFAAAGMHAAGLTDQAESLVHALDERLLDDKTRAVRANNLAVLRIHRGNYAGARDALLAVSGSGDATVRRQLGCTDALLRVYEGRPKEALDALGPDSEDERYPSETAMRIAIRAHAHAALGAREPARAALDRLRRTPGVDPLAAAIEPQGPATELAKEMRAVPASRGARA